MNKPLSILGVIPSRYASVRLPAKPLVDLCGKPMVQRVYEQAKQSKLLTRVVVATDHEEIVAAVKRFGGNVVMTSPELQSGSDRVAAVAQLEPDADIIVNIQGDEPLIEPRMIDQAIQPLIDNPDIQVGTLIKKITSQDEMVSPNIVKVALDAQGFGLYFSRSPIPYLRDGIPLEQWYQHYPYYKHIGLYVFRRSFLLQYSSWQESTLEKMEKLEQLRILVNGYKIKTAITEFDSIPVDTLEDAEKVRSVLRQKETV